MKKAENIINSIEEYAPLELAEKWDSVGLMIGDKNADVSKVLLCLDVTQEVVNEAIELGCQMIVSHHPFIFHALKNIDVSRAKGKIITALLKNNISVYSAHTNLDYADNGVNDCLFKCVAKALNKEGMSAEKFAKVIKEETGCATVKIMQGNGITIKSAMSACGAFDGNIQAVFESGADALVVGEIKYNDSVELIENGMTIFEIGHYDSEKIVLPVLKNYLNEIHTDVDFYLTSVGFKATIIY